MKDNILIAVIVFCLGFVVGAKTFNPPEFIIYKSVEDLIIRCEEWEGVFHQEGRKAWCEKKEFLFTNPIEDKFYYSLEE